jgi:CRP-like cAMP-binding protein
MPNVGTKPNILKVSAKLKKTLTTAGTVEQYPSHQRLFDVDQANTGVFLVAKGKVCLSMKDFPQFDRVFNSGSLLGVPATFTGHPYSLEAIAVTKAEVVHIDRQKFLEVMTTQPELCREATDMLSREVSFIHTALAERRRTKIESE